MSEVKGTAIEISGQLATRLSELADQAGRPVADLADEAIAEYIERYAEQIVEVRKALDEVRSGAPTIPHAEVERWVKSWGTENELPRPRAKR